nr:hypothetical protein [Tanacetum cinerariifolium]
MTGDRSQLTNFVNKFLGTVKFGNDHVAKIIGYGDYQIGNVTISSVYVMEGLGHNLLSVGQFCDSDLEVAFRQHTYFIHNLEGVNLSQRLSHGYGTDACHLNFGAINYLARQGLVWGLPKLKFEKDHLCSAYAMGKSKKKSHKPKSKDTNQEKLYLLYMDLCGPMCVKSVNGKKLASLMKHLLLALHSKIVSLKDAEAVTTAYYTQNRSIVRLRHRKTPYELLHNKLPDLSFLYVFGALCYPTNDSENLGKLQPKADIEIFIGYAPTKKAIRIYNRRLVPNPTSSTPFVSLSRNEWDLLFQPLFNELLTPPPSVDPSVHEVIAPVDEVVAPELAESPSSPSSTTVDQDAPSPSKSQTTPETQPPFIPNDVEEGNHDIEVAYMGNDLLFGMPITDVASDQSSSTTYKDALTQSCWIEAMQEELNEFEWLGVWELVPRPYKVMVITLKWIYKVKLDELGGILKNKARLVARGYHQEEGSDFEVFCFGCKIRGYKDLSRV